VAGSLPDAAPPVVEPARAAAPIQAPAATAPRTEPSDRTRVLEELAALAGPAELSVRELELPPLTIDPVAVESLGLASLQIADIGGSSEFKE
jgi:hypothetical protein